ncbi:hypothetical protein GCM10022242_25440 [Nocardioides panacisoli]|uniref:CHRD domain-containing protein n=1 Tax=Nocardioides panacisoli TaxID=627624 RepID=A0ABP7INC1_9ACTN
MLTLTAAGAVGVSLSNSSAAPSAHRGADVTTNAKLDPLNNSAASGHAQVTISGSNLKVVLNARRLLKGMPHAEHIHFGPKARHECPSVRDDSNSDHRLNTAEGTPAYGPVRISLTTKGDTSPDSTLAVNRFPTAPKGRISYSRTIHVKPALAERIAAGKGVLVIHGIDYNHNGKYDFKGAGKSELDPSLPAEATDPVLCGRLQ